MSLRDDFFNVKDQPHKDIEIEGWGKVRIRGLTTGQWLDIFGSSGVQEAVRRAGDTTARLIIATVYDPETDAPVFTDDDVETFKKLPSSRVKPILEIVSAMRELPASDDILDGAKKNSEVTTDLESSPS